MAFVIDRSLYLSPEVVVEPLRSAPLEVNEDPFSLEALVAWLEKQPGNVEYCYTSNGDCLIARYLTYRGIPFNAVVALGKYWDDDYTTHNTSAEIHSVAVNRPHIYSAALSRARKLLAEREK